MSAPRDTGNSSGGMQSSSFSSSSPRLRLLSENAASCSAASARCTSPSSDRFTERLIESYLPPDPKGLPICPRTPTKRRHRSRPRSPPRCPRRPTRRQVLPSLPHSALHVAVIRQVHREADRKLPAPGSKRLARCPRKPTKRRHLPRPRSPPHCLRRPTRRQVLPSLPRSCHHLFLTVAQSEPWSGLSSSSPSSSLSSGFFFFLPLSHCFPPS